MAKTGDVLQSGSQWSCLKTGILEPYYSVGLYFRVSK